MSAITASGCLPLARARMRVQINAPAVSVKQFKLKEKLLEISSVVLDTDEWLSAEWQAVITADPGQFNLIESLVKDCSKGNASIVILDMNEKNVMDEIF